MNPEHAALLAEIRLAARPVIRDEWPQNDSYGGSGHRFYFTSVPARRAIAKRWLAGHRKIADADFLAVVESLFGGESHEEKTLAALLLGYHARGRRAVIPSDIERWLGELNGWAEVDCLCAGPFKAAEMASAWPAWRADRAFARERRYQSPPRGPGSAHRPHKAVERDPVRRSRSRHDQRPRARARDPDHQGRFLATALDGRTASIDGRDLSRSAPGNFA